MKTGSAPVVNAPEEGPGLKYGAKRLFLGRPLFTERLEHERLTNKIALAVFSSDAMSSVAYGGEEMLRVMIPIIGVTAFTFLGPLSLVIVAVLAILVFSYRQTIKAYPSQEALTSSRATTSACSPPRSPVLRCSPTTYSPWPSPPRPGFRR